MDPQIVQNENFPQTIPKKRERRDVLMQILCGVTCEIVGCLLTSHNIFHYIGTATYSYLFFGIMDYCQRSCFLVEEYYHLSSRYEGKLLKLLCATYKCNNYSLIFTVISSLVTATQVCPMNLIQSDGIVPLFCSLGAMYFFAKVTNLEYSPIRTAKLIDELEGLDYGSGMAHSFFHGYLKLILPCTGDERKGLKEQITDYEGKHNVVFVTKKLYILIPLSAHCPSSIEERSKIEMEPSDSLDWRRMDRAGVKQRQYHNSVYKIWIGEGYRRKPIYVCAEYASPLLTFHAVIHHKTRFSSVYYKHRNEIMTNFYMTLKYILENDPDCADLCELIYYRDIDCSDRHLTTDEMDVGKLLVDRILRSRIRT